MNLLFISFSKANEFRSKVILDIGDPYEIPQEIYDLYAKNKKEAVQKLLEEIENVRFHIKIIQIKIITRDLKAV